MRHAKTLTSLAVLGLLAPMAAVAAGGTIVKLDGSASVIRKGATAIVAESSRIQSGDTLTVAPESKAQLHLEDDTVFAVPGIARLRIDEFRMPTRKSGGTAVYTLEEGGFHTIVGSVGRGANDRYEVRTPYATLTVTGSAYSSLICSRQCARTYKPGLYVRSGDAVVTIKNAGGELKLRAGQTAFVEADGSAPVLATLSPFVEPTIAAGYGVEVDFAATIHPRRIEQEQSPSP